MTEQAAQPRPAATLLLIRDDPLEVLMARRRAGGPFSSALVFPGGGVDAEDLSEAWLPLLDGAAELSVNERALRIAAIRETYEEAGVLTAADPGVAYPPPVSGAAAAAFREMVADTGHRLDLSKIVPFGHWITPPVVSRRFDTHFFLAEAPPEHVAVCDGEEIIALEWLKPADVLAGHEQGERTIMLPTRMNLLRLAQSDSTEAALRAAAATPVFTVCPRLEHRPDGVFTVIPEEAGYGVTEEARP